MEKKKYLRKSKIKLTEHEKNVLKLLNGMNAKDAKTILKNAIKAIGKEKIVDIEDHDELIGFKMIREERGARYKN